VCVNTQIFSCYILYIPSTYIHIYSARHGREQVRMIDK